MKEGKECEDGVLPFVQTLWELTAAVWYVCSLPRSCMMQADSEKLRQAWITAVQNSIATAFRDKGDDGEVKSELNS